MQEEDTNKKLTQTNDKAETPFVKNSRDSIKGSVQDTMLNYNTPSSKGEQQQINPKQNLVQLRQTQLQTEKVKEPKQNVDFEDFKNKRKTNPTIKHQFDAKEFNTNIIPEIPSQIQEASQISEPTKVPAQNKVGSESKNKKFEPYPQQPNNVTQSNFQKDRNSISYSSDLKSNKLPLNVTTEIATPEPIITKNIQNNDQKTEIACSIPIISPTIPKNIQNNDKQAEISIKEVVTRTKSIQANEKNIPEVNENVMTDSIFRWTKQNNDKDLFDLNPKNTSENIVISRTGGIEILSTGTNEELNATEQRLKQQEKEQQDDLDNYFKSQNEPGSDNVVQPRFQINRRTFEITQVRGDQIYQKKLVVIVRIQRKYRAKLQVKQYKAMVKKHRYRKNVIKELITTEDKYVQDLTFLEDKIINPLTALIDQALAKKLFQNLSGIIGINKFMLDALQVQLKSYTPYQQTMAAVVQFIAFFKLYFDYCNGYRESQKAEETLLKDNAKFIEFFAKIKTANTLKGYDLQSYLIRPVQRLPKYVLLFKDLLKHTDKDHPDFNNITKCYDEFSKINAANNSKMERHLANLRMFELQRLFPEQQLVHSKNEFFFEEACTLQHENAEKSAILYAFTNQILFSCKEDNVEKIFLILNLNHQSLCKDSWDSQYFSHLISVVGQNDTVQLICQNDESKQKLMNDILKIISKLKSISDFKKVIGQQEQDDHQVVVQVIGTEERNSTQLHQHTVYITEIKLNETCYKVFLRYSQVAEMEAIVKKKFPKVQIPHFTSMRWLSSHSPKIIEERRILIERFIQIILSSDEIRKEPEVILQKLGVPSNFFELPAASLNQSTITVVEPKATIEIQSSVVTNASNAKIRKSVSQVIKAKKDQMTSSRVTPVTPPGQTSIIIGEKAKDSGYTISVHLMTGQNLQVGFEKDARVLDIKEEVATFIGLQASNDFMLFAIDGPNIYRILDEEETISSRMTVQKESKLTSMFKFNSLKKQIYNTIFGKENNYIMRKYFFLTWELEEQDFREDPIRLGLIVTQILDEVKNEKYVLGAHQYFLLAAQFIYLTGECDGTKNINQYLTANLDKLRNIIPMNLLKNLTKVQWVEHVSGVYSSLDEQINQIQSLNIKSQDENTNKSLIDKVQICSLVLLNTIKSNPLIGMSIFYVECPKETIAKAKKHDINLAVNVYIGLNFKGLHLANPRKEIFKSFKYEEISELKSFTQEIILKIYDFEESFSFTTITGYEIKVLMEEYRKLQDLAYL